MANNNMVNDIVNDIAKLADRVEGLEGQDSNALSVARINKVYPKLGVKVTFTAFKQFGNYPGSGMYPHSGQFAIGGNTVLKGDLG